MTQDEIIRMAREATEQLSDADSVKLQGIVLLALDAGAAHEREKQAEQVIVDNGSEVSSETEAQEPVHIENIYKRGDKYFAWIGDDYVQIYAAPVRTKDLTDDEILAVTLGCTNSVSIARAVIAADREKNK